MFKILYLAALLFLVSAAILLFGKILNRKQKRISWGFVSVFFILAGFVCNTWVQMLPPLREPVTLTALGQKNPEAKAREISIKGLSVDSKEYEPDHIKEGKWFYTGSRYMWRPEWDERQPEGTTRRIVLEVPIGTDRSIQFLKTEWGGKVDVSVYGKHTVVDTFQQQELSLPDSRKKFQAFRLLYQVGALTLFLTISGLLLSAYLRVFTSARAGEKAKSRMTFLAIAAASLAFMVTYSQNHTLWLDEMFQIGFSGTGKSLYETLMVTETTPPLFRLAANLWYNLVPYGEEWLLLLPELACAGAVYVIGLLGEAWHSRRIGVLAAVSVAVSSSMITSAAYEFRAYGFLLFFSATFLLSYVKRLKKGKEASWKNILSMGLWMIPLAYTHYFGVFLCMAVFLYDVLLFATKKIKWTAVWSYLLVFVSYIPWMFRFLQLNQLELSADWQTKPSFHSVFELISFLSGGGLLPLLLFAVGTVGLLLRTYALRHTAESSLKPFLSAFPPALLFILISCLYLYGSLLKPDATLWVHRYFFVLTPLSALVVAIGGEMLIRFADTVLQRVPLRNVRSATLTKAVCGLLIFSLFAVGFPTVSKQPSVKNHGQIYDKAANWLYDQTLTIYDPATLVISADQAYVGDGWYEYYMTRQGQRDDVNYISQEALLQQAASDDMQFQKFFEKYDTVYVCYAERVIDPRLETFLEQNYIMSENNTKVEIKTFVKEEPAEAEA